MSAARNMPHASRGASGGGGSEVAVELNTKDTKDTKEALVVAGDAPRSRALVFWVKLR